LAVSVVPVIAAGVVPPIGPGLAGSNGLVHDKSPEPSVFNNWFTFPSEVGNVSV
jgi:hypothetical protein